MTTNPAICITVLAYNEEGRIATCLKSLPLNNDNVAIHVVVNGSSDSTAKIARQIAGGASNVMVHEYAEGGKARSWNRFIFGDLPQVHDAHVFVDGDAEVLPGSINALASTLANSPEANAASGLPMNGRKAEHYREMIRRDHGIFGDLYALSGEFVRRMRAGGIKLPEDVVGDDGLICAMAKTDLADESNWLDARVAVCEDAGFLCAPVAAFDPKSWLMQYRRMVNYSVRHFQNGMITPIMRADGPAKLPTRLADLYGETLPRLRPRSHPQLYWFDRAALRRMRRAISA